MKKYVAKRKTVEAIRVMSSKSGELNRRLVVMSVLFILGPKTKDEIAAVIDAMPYVLTENMTGASYFHILVREGKLVEV